MIKTKLAIIQPSPLCNINCHYCYLPDRTSKKRMSIHTLEQIGKALFSSPFVRDSITIVWHAGEPLVVPLNFYKQAFQCLQELNQRYQNVRIVHTFQTNATLIDSEWCEFFKQYEVQIGVSLDGPQPLHDAHRVNRAGHGTFERAMRGISLLQQHDIPFAVIAVITKQTFQHTEEFWQFFKTLRPSKLCLNPEEIEGANQTTSLEGEESIQQYKKFLKDLLIYNEQEHDQLPIREVNAIYQRVREGGPVTRSHANVAGSIFSFDCDGNISTFSPELLTARHRRFKNFHFGNVFTETLEESFKTTSFQAIQEEIQEGVFNCFQSCEYFMFCGGGFPSNKYSEHNSFRVTETHNCRIRVKASVDVLLEFWEERYQSRLSALSSDQHNHEETPWFF